MKRRSDLLIGLFFVFAAILLIVNEVGGYWEISIAKSVVSIVLIGIIIKSVLKCSFGGILFPIAFIIILFDEELNLEAITPVPVILTAILGTIGLNMIFKNHRWNCWNSYRCDDHSFRDTVEEDNNNEVNCSVNFGSSIKYITAEDFKRGNFKCSFGDLKVYFDKATIQGNEATITIDLSFGGMELYIPRTWNVKFNVATSFAGIDEKCRPGYISETPVVTINGNASFGGVDIYYI